MSKKLENNFRWDSCPLCHSSHVHKFGDADYGAKVQFSTQEIELSNHPEIWNCDRCTSGFVQNIIPKAISESLYSTSPAGERWSITPFEQAKTVEVVNIMRDVFVNSGRVLDVGCNTGQLLDFAKTLGWATSGLEYSDSSREVIHGKGHAAYQSIDQISDQFEVITAFDLVEHLYDVPGFLDRCHAKLAYAGKLIILTGDIQSASAKAAGADWWYAQFPEHIVFPAKKYFEGLSNFTLESWLPTYAAEGYKYPLSRHLMSFIKRVVTGNNYSGQPSLTPDHALIVLTKLPAEKKQSNMPGAMSGNK
jgi:SAM-dependent methyltransferase